MTSNFDNPENDFKAILGRQNQCKLQHTGANLPRKLNSCGGMQSRAIQTIVSKKRISEFSKI